MTTHRNRLWAGFLLAGLALLAFQSLYGAIAQSSSPRGTIIELKGPVTPASAAYLIREIEAASARRDELVVMEIDTPGGLVTSMKDIIQTILSSDTPVVTFVSPQGAQSASAGLYIMYAAHVSAMAPATNTGSATPIELGGSGEREEPLFAPTETDETTSDEAAPADISNDASMRGKIIEDSVSYIKGLAEKRGRNAEWAEKAVRPPSASVTASEALELNIIDIVADDLDDLMTQLNGRSVEVNYEERVLNTDNIVLTRSEPSLIDMILAFLADPNLAAILLTLGTTGLIAELWNPGSILPGTIGIICLLLALAAFSVLPYNGLFLALMGVGAALIFLEFFTPTFGVSGVIGLAIFATGLWFLFPEEMRVGPGVMVATVGTAGLLLTLALFAFAGSRAGGPLIGKEAIRRREGRVDDWDAKKGEGHVIVDGERWRAKSRDPLQEGDKIKVQEVDGIVLIVRKNGATPVINRLMPNRTKQPS